MEIEWLHDAEIRFPIRGGEATLSANRAGLLSLAAQLTRLAEEAPGCHVHYDACNSLGDGSDELIVERA